MQGCGFVEAAATVAVELGYQLVGAKNLNSKLGFSLGSGAKESLVTRQEIVDAGIDRSGQVPVIAVPGSWREGGHATKDRLAWLHGGEVVEFARPRDQSAAELSIRSGVALFEELIGGAKLNKICNPGIEQIAGVFALASTPNEILEDHLVESSQRPILNQRIEEIRLIRLAVAMKPLGQRECIDSSSGALADRPESNLGPKPVCREVTAALQLDAEAVAVTLRDCV